MSSSTRPTTNPAANAPKKSPYNKPLWATIGSVAGLFLLVWFIFPNATMAVRRWTRILYTEGSKAGNDTAGDYEFGTGEFVVAKDNIPLQYVRRLGPDGKTVEDWEPAPDSAVRKGTRGFLAEGYKPSETQGTPRAMKRVVWQTKDDKDLVRAELRAKKGEGYWVLGSLVRSDNELLSKSPDTKGDCDAPGPETSETTETADHEWEVRFGPGEQPYPPTDTAIPKGWQVTVEVKENKFFPYSQWSKEQCKRYPTSGEPWANHTEDERKHWESSMLYGTNHGLMAIMVLPEGKPALSFPKGKKTLTFSNPDKPSLVWKVHVNDYTFDNATAANAKYFGGHVTLVVTMKEIPKKK